MVFSSTVFLFLFLPVILILYYNPVIKSRQFKNTILILSSLFFYAWGEPVYILIMLGSIIFNWLFGLAVDKFRGNKNLSRFFVALSVVANIGVLFVFKYLGFTVRNIDSIFRTDFAVPDIALPIGISFFTFQAMSYVIDIYRRNGEVQKNPMNVALYISFFPQLIAGPIVRYSTISEQISNRTENFDDFSEGVYRFIIGFCKKVLIANNVALVADAAFGAKELSVSMAWLGAISYTLQIFFDFSGYSDMAIGLGKMFGFTFLENFNYPYMSKSVSEFWRRWHISLGSWFRDYVYIPLGGSRVGKARLVLNLFVVWFLTGLWHGAEWTFIVWGLMYFVLLTVEKLTGFTEKLGPFKYIYTMFFVIIGWVIFRSETMPEAIEYFKAMFGIGASGLVDGTAKMYLSYYKVYLAAGILCSFPIMTFIKSKIKINEKFYTFISRAVLLVLFAIALTFNVKGSYNPFIYFNF